ncbi:MAG: helix-turn-helix domain-containing protein [Planctomycetes bacterium]|nr:helix-turn-helix domain-containing protein [Planctomycetota bacterium]
MIRAENDRRGDAKSLDRLALSADEVAAMLGISRAHVWKLASTGRLPRPIRLGRAVRWDRKNLEAWLAAGAPSRDRWEAVRVPGRENH